MTAKAPHFLLFSRSSREVATPHGPGSRWHFRLQAIDGSTHLEASDEEPGVYGERAELLAVVRGLEALDQPSCVTLLTPSQRVSQRMTCGLDEWSENGWRWERYGKMVPVKNHDLWRRIGAAMHFHRVECEAWQQDSPLQREGLHESPSVPTQEIPASNRGSEAESRQGEAPVDPTLQENRNTPPPVEPPSGETWPTSNCYDRNRPDNGETPVTPSTGSKPPPIQRKSRLVGLRRFVSRLAGALPKKGGHIREGTICRKKTAFSGCD